MTNCNEDLAASAVISYGITALATPESSKNGQADAKDLEEGVKNNEIIVQELFEDDEEQEEEGEDGTSPADKLHQQNHQTFGLHNQSSIMDISVGEAYRGQGPFTNALVPIPEDSDTTTNFDQVVGRFNDDDDGDGDDLTRETVTRDSSNGFYKKSPKAHHQDSLGTLAAAANPPTATTTNKPYFQYDSEETSMMMRASGHFNN